ncbi:hypothetical protein DFJ73DRAFT_764580 [Zopfochytrium polystomum]|nr:hypothetical protein DFJ73DRAFT_764580 [Zopfochytrium polystomum]
MSSVNEDIGSLVKLALQHADISLREERVNVERQAASSFVDDCVEVFRDAAFEDEDYDDGDRDHQSDCETQSSDDDEDEIEHLEAGEACLEKRSSTQQARRHLQKLQGIAMQRLGTVLRNELFDYIAKKNKEYYGPELAIVKPGYKKLRLDRSEKLKDIASRIMRRRQTTLRADNLAMNFVRSWRIGFSWIRLLAASYRISLRVVQFNYETPANGQADARMKKAASRLNSLGKKFFILIFEPELEPPTSSAHLKTKMRSFVFNSNKQSSSENPDVMAGTLFEAEVDPEKFEQQLRGCWREIGRKQRGIRTSTMCNFTHGTATRANEPLNTNFNCLGQYEYLIPACGPVNALVMLLQEWKTKRQDQISHSRFIAALPHKDSL